MANSSSHHSRVKARRCAVQAIYQWLVTATDPQKIVDEFIAEREMKKVDIAYFSELSCAVPKHSAELIADIEPAIDREWQHIDTVEQSVLLLGTYELRYCLYIPWRVVINESIELCKMFGAEDAHRYVNGVLEKVANARRATEINA